MSIFRVLAAVIFLFAGLHGSAVAQTTLRIALAEDPDILDPTLSRTLAGKMVFAAICVSCAVFTWKVMPETKGVSLEAIGEFWRSRAAGNAHKPPAVKDKV